jgi:excisionase family DNA binding protein
MYVSIAEAAAHYGVSDKSLRRWIAAGLIKAERIGPKLIRVDLESLRTTPVGGASE